MRPVTLQPATEVSNPLMVEGRSRTREEPEEENEGATREEEKLTSGVYTAHRTGALYFSSAQPGTGRLENDLQRSRRWWTAVLAS
jgi:hypothetical protein